MCVWVCVCVLLLVAQTSCPHGQNVLCCVVVSLLPWDNHSWAGRLPESTQSHQLAFGFFSPTKFHGVRAEVLSPKHALTAFVLCPVVTGLVLQWEKKRSSGPELAYFMICAVFECCALICGAPYISWTYLHRPPGYCYWLFCAVAYRCWNSPNSPHSLSLQI